MVGVSRKNVVGVIVCISCSCFSECDVSCACDMFIEAKVQSRRDVTNFGKAAMSQDKGRVILMFLRMRV